MLMSQPRQFHHHHHHQHMMGGGGSGGGGGGGGGQFNDTTFTKIFVGGLAWETQRDTMRKYFEEFGEILEAVVITDKATGRSKGYGFVTFKDAEAAVRACQNPAPVIDGRKANCNLASLGAQKSRPPAASHQVGGPGWFRSAASGPGLVAPPAFPASTYFQVQQSAQLTFPYSAYGYTGFSHDAMHPVSYYGMYGSQQYSPYYTGGGGGGSGGGGAAGYVHSVYPYYGSYTAAQGSQTQQHQHGGYGIHYNHPAAGHMLQYSYFPHQQQQQHFPSTSGTLSLPATSLAFPAAAISLGLAPAAGSQSGAELGQVHPPQAAGASGAVSENNSSST